MPNVNFSLTWRPFQLNPTFPKEGVERKKYLESKFNSKENAKKIYQNIYDEGVKNNIYFQFEKIKVTPNSFASHKLLALAHKFKKQTEIVESLFYDYFIEGIDIGNLDGLLKIAKQHKIYDINTLQYLQSNQDDENLLAEEKQARKLKIQGVPCFIINREFVLFGAQDKKIFLDIFNNIQNEH